MYYFITFVQQTFDMIEDIRKGGKLLTILQQLCQIVGNALCRLLVIIVTITHFE